MSEQHSGAHPAGHPPGPPHGGPGRMFGPKDQSPLTVSEFPETYKYVLQHVGEKKVQVDLRLEGDKLDRAGMSASPDEYQFLAWLLATTNAKKVAEVGVFRGVSTLAFALQLPSDGKVYGLELDLENTAIGIKAFEAAGVSDKINLIGGPAMQSMEKLLQEGHEGTFDFVFIDANKNDYPQYYELSLRLLRVGGIVAVDNTLLHGSVLLTDDSEMRRGATGIIELNKIIQSDTRVSAVMIPLADGIYLARKL